MTKAHPWNWTRRATLGGLAAGAGFGALGWNSNAAEPPPETDRIRLVYDPQMPIMCYAPQLIAELDERGSRFGQLARECSRAHTHLRGNDLGLCLAPREMVHDLTLDLVEKRWPVGVTASQDILAICPQDFQQLVVSRRQGGGQVRPLQHQTEGNGVTYHASI